MCEEYPLGAQDCFSKQEFDAFALEATMAVMEHGPKAVKCPNDSCGSMMEVADDAEVPPVIAEKASSSRGADHVWVPR